MGIGNILKSSIIPIVLIVIMLDIGVVLGMIPVLNFLLCVTGPISWLVSALIVAWAGYSAVKGGSAVMGAATTGAVVGFFSQLLVQILAVIVNLLGLGLTAANNADTSGSMMGVGLGVVGLIAWPIIGAIGGAILGAIGGVVAGSPKK